VNVSRRFRSVGLDVVALIVAFVIFVVPFIFRFRKKAAMSEDAPTRFEIVCDHCGKHDTVPFQPKVGRSVLCKECHEASRSRAKFV